MIRFVILCFISIDIILNTNAIQLKKRETNTNFCNPTKDDKLNVHIISHTHLDAGWVKTYDGYYQDSVKEIIKTVIEGLTNLEGLESRKFTFVEMSYFSRYWNSVGPEQKQVIQDLVTSGKLQFTSGGWVMNDEATPHYSMIIDQMSYGHRWINRTFGRKYLPTTGWQIDPFGHTIEFGSILSQIGFNALFLGRIDYQDKEKRMSDKSMEFIWKTDPNLKQNNFLFTGITPTGYYPSEGVSLNGDPEHNGKNLVKKVMEQTKGYRTNHIMATMGGDFHYVYAELNLKNLDKLIEYVNSIQNETHLVYSTPDCYVKAVYESGINWEDTKIDDFMPYADNHNDFWSGYFTSRPAFKYLMNYANSVLQISKQLIAKADLFSDVRQLIQPLEEAVGIGLHHDAISGTSKQFVSDDYVRMLSTGLSSAEELIAIAYQKLFSAEEKPQFCHKLNASDCPFLDRLEGLPAEIALYNPLAHRVSDYIRLPLIDPNYQILDSNGNPVESQIIPIPDHIQSLAERKSGAKFELLFKAHLDPLTFTKYQLKNILEPRPDVSTPNVSRKTEDIVLSNDKIKVIIDGNSGLLKSIQREGFDTEIGQNFGYYTRGTGKNSGAYAMHTHGTEPFLLSEKVTVTVNKGNITQEVIQEFTPYVKQIIRIYDNSDYVEFDWTVGPLPKDKDIEVISRYDTGFRSDQTFYTDSNGRQSVERIRDFRPTWDLKTDEKVSSNYYPITGWIFIRDQLSDLQLTLVPDRTQGGSSLNNGSIELMLHRRLNYDDGYGMEEKLSEPGVDGNGLVVRGKHYLFIDKIENSMKRVKTFSKRLFWKPLPLFVPISQKSNELETKSDVKPFNGITFKNGKIDSFLHLLTFEELEPNVLFVRLEYILEANESKDESINTSLNELFSGIEILTVMETSLTGAELMSEMMSRKYKWMCSDCNNQTQSSTDSQLTDMTIILTPNQIRSFILKIKRS